MNETDFEPIEITVQHGFSYSMMACFCGRTFQGRDSKRVHQHFTKHARRCTSARTARKWAKKALALNPQYPFIPADLNGMINQIAYVPTLLVRQESPAP